MGSLWLDVLPFASPHPRNSRHESSALPIVPLLAGDGCVHSQS
jgi:hypothetical protein